MPRSALELTTAIASGDAEAFASFYREWFDFAFAAAQRDTNGDEQFCLDVVQDAMLRVIRRMKPLQSQAALRAWLRTVVKSCAYDQLRRRRRQFNREQLAARNRRELYERDNELAARLGWLRQHLRQLKPEETHLLSLRFRLGWTLARIGSTLGLKPGAVDGRIARAIEALRLQAREEFNEE